MRSTVRCPAIKRNKRKKPAAPYSRMGESHTTLGEGALDFRVRNGNGYDNSSMATGKKPLSMKLKRNATHENAEDPLQVKSEKIS